jgi:hypothetical protein
LIALLSVMAFCSQGAVASYTPLSTSNYTTAYNALVSYFKANITNQLLAARLAFHGCVGGCDGCLNINQSDNAGLSSIVTALDSLYTANYSTQMSRADFWAISGLAAVGQGINLANSNCTTTKNCNVPALSTVFRSGRVDCSTAPYTSTNYTFPSGAMNNTAMLSFFSTYFGFNATQVAALMGVHTLGFALPQNSGYTGIWKPSNVATFTNAYYQEMLNSNMNWTAANRVQPANATAKWAWFGNSSGLETFMLHTDFEVFYTVTMDSNSDPTCSVSSSNLTCAQASTYSTAYTYSTNVTRWITDFSSVFGLMLENTNATLSSLT